MMHAGGQCWPILHANSNCCTNGEHECWFGIALFELLIVSQIHHWIKHKSPALLEIASSYFAFIVIIMKLAFSLIPRSVVVIGFLLFFRQGPSVLAASPEDGDNTIGHSILRPVSSKLSLQNDYGAEDSSSAVRAKKDGSPAAPSRGHFLRSPPALRKEEQEERLLKKNFISDFDAVKDAISLIPNKKVRKDLEKELKNLIKEYTKVQFDIKLRALVEKGDISLAMFRDINSALKIVRVRIQLTPPVPPSTSTTSISTTTSTVPVSTTTTSSTTSTTTPDVSTTSVSTTTTSTTTPDVSTTPVSTTTTSINNGEGAIESPCLLVDGGIS